MKPTWKEIYRQIEEAEYRAWLLSLQTPPWAPTAKGEQK